jgi:hypothetical protein
MEYKIPIQDKKFDHSFSSSWYNRPTHFEWIRNNYENFNFVVLTNLFDVDKYPNKKVIGWIIEPPTIDGSQYEYAKVNHHKFFKIFTYDEELMNITDKFELVPIGGSWIEVDERKIYQKNKLLNIIVSEKKMTFGHILRHRIVESFSQLDVMGRGYKIYDKKVDMLRDYMFSIVVENQKMNSLFTEKIIDCFMTGTIPLYYGCPKISEYFDDRGIICFDTLEELQDIIKNLSIEDYTRRIEFVNENFELAKKYVIADDIIFDKLKELKLF